MGQFYEGTNSLFVEAYDALNRPDRSQVAGDVDFYMGLAERCAGAVLEVACGTGRVTLPLAEAGITITGVDCSEGMLSVARQKASSLTKEARRRLTLVRQDMSELQLDERYGFVFVPFRSFQHLLTSEQQRKALACFHRHLEPAGRLALHLFDPRLDLLTDDQAQLPGLSGTDQATGRRYTADMVQTRFDYVAQVRYDLWRYKELGQDGSVLREDAREMPLRWTYRWELYHLLALTGFVVEAEYSDFRVSPPAYGKELILVGRID